MPRFGKVHRRSSGGVNRELPYVKTLGGVKWCAFRRTTESLVAHVAGLPCYHELYVARGPCPTEIQIETFSFRCLSMSWKICSMRACLLFVVSHFVFCMGAASVVSAAFGLGRVVFRGDRVAGRSRDLGCPFCRVCGLSGRRTFYKIVKYTIETARVVLG